MAPLKSDIAIGSLINRLPHFRPAATRAVASSSHFGGHVNPLPSSSVDVVSDANQE
jgi:hypothetical protein